MLKKYALIGRSLQHSVSPLIHNTAFKIHHIPALYEKIEVETQNLSTTVEFLKRGNYAGLNITIPYKNSIIPLLDEVEEVSAKIGSVNTICIEEGKWVGYNTDIFGIFLPLKKLKRNFKDCLILGTGGAARSVMYSLLKVFKPDSITIAGRNYMVGQDLNNHFKDFNRGTRLRFVNIQECLPVSERVDLIINATPVGMFPDINASPLPGLKQLKRRTVVFDLIYNPLRTRLMADAEKVSESCITIGGLEMLLIQAAESFNFWTGKKIPYNAVKKAVLEYLGT